MILLVLHVISSIIILLYFIFKHKSEVPILISLFAIIEAIYIAIWAKELLAIKGNSDYYVSSYDNIFNLADLIVLCGMYYQIWYKKKQYRP